MTMYALLLNHAEQLNQFWADKQKSLTDLQTAQLRRFGELIDGNKEIRNKIKRLIKQETDQWEQEWEDDGERFKALKMIQQIEREELIRQTNVKERFKQFLLEDELLQAS